MAGFFTSYGGQLLLNFAITGIVAIGFYLTFLSGQLSVAHQMFMSIGAYAAGYLSVEYGWGLWESIPVSMLTAAIVGAATAAVTSWLSGMHLAIATLALSESLVVLLNNVPAVGGIFGLAGISIDATGPIIIGALLVVVAVAVLIDVSPFGLWLRSVADDELAAAAAGVRTRLARVLAFAIGAAIAGLGGSLYAHRFGYIEPSTFGLTLGLQFLLAVKLGGRAFVGGPLVGAAVVIWLPEVLRPIGVDRDIAFGAILILIVILRPDGVVGRRVGVLSVASRLWRLGSRRGSAGGVPQAELEGSGA